MILKSHDEVAIKPGFASFVAFMFAFEGIVNFSLNDRMWSFASSDSAYSFVFASLGKVGFVAFALKGRACSMDPMLTFD